MVTYRKLLACILGSSVICFSHAAFAANDSISVGVEGFRDHYREPDPDVQVDEHADYGSVTGNYTHYMGAMRTVFTAIDGRASYGEDNYKSLSGTDNNIPQMEFDGRLRGGVSIPSGGAIFSPYVGVGTRYFYDKSKNTVTTLDFFGYDRRILQFYAPVGTTVQFNAGSWTFSPTVEFDPLLVGKVNSTACKTAARAMPTSPTPKPAVMAGAGEFMVGQQMQGYRWELGPFVRYWDIKQSNLTTAPDMVRSGSSHEE